MHFYLPAEGGALTQVWHVWRRLTVWEELESMVFNAREAAGQTSSATNGVALDARLRHWNKWESSLMARGHQYEGLGHILRKWRVKLFWGDVGMIWCTVSFSTCFNHYHHLEKTRFQLLIKPGILQVALRVRSHLQWLHGCRIG